MAWTLPDPSTSQGVALQTIELEARGEHPEKPLGGLTLVQWRGACVELQRKGLIRVNEQGRRVPVLVS